MTEIQTEATGGKAAAVTDAQESSEPAPPTGVARVRGAWAMLRRCVRADFDLMRNNRAKYLADNIAPDSLATEAIKRIGVQIMLAIRVMHFMRDAGFMPGAMVLSRLYRHVYNMEVHPKAEFEPGINVVHGNGLIIGSEAYVSEGCVLLHEVTLGNAFDHSRGCIGGPRLERNVHIGPGSKIIGAITIGAESKVLAGSILTESVPSRSLVRPAPPVITPRNA